MFQRLLSQCLINEVFFRSIQMQFRCWQPVTAHSVGGPATSAQKRRPGTGLHQQWVMLGNDKDKQIRLPANKLDVGTIVLVSAFISSTGGLQEKESGSPKFVFEMR